MSEVCEGKCLGLSPGDESLTFMRCNAYMKTLWGGGFSVTFLRFFLFMALMIEDSEVEGETLS